MGACQRVALRSLPNLGRNEHGQEHVLAQRGPRGAVSPSGKRAHQQSRQLPAFVAPGWRRDAGAASVDGGGKGMSERTAMDIAIDLDAVACSAFVKLEAAKMLRSQAAEIDRLIAERDAAIAAAVAAEREACAKVCDSFGAYGCAIKIRERGKPWPHN